MNAASLSLVAAPTSARPAGKATVLDFDPARDGFAFANVFAWSEDDLAVLSSELRPLVMGLGIGAPPVLGRILGGRRGLLAGIVGGLGLGITSDLLIRRLARRWPTFGLCGGMALLAKERWESGSNESTASLKRDAIRPILRLRQARTIRATWPQFLSFWLQALTTKGVFAPDRLQAEVEKVCAEIDAGRPVILGLVGDTPDPFALHQVVVFGCEVGPGQTKLHVYDPNAPGRTRHVVIRLVEGGATIETDLPTGPKKEGGYHISRTSGRLSMVFVVDA